MPKKHKHKEEEHLKEHHKKKKPGISSKLIVLMIIVLACFIFFRLRFEIMEILKQNPAVWAVFSYVSHHLSQNTLTGLFLIIFISSLFFTTVPTEIFFLFYLTTSHNPVLIIIITIIANTLGLTFNFIVGFILGKKIMMFFLGSSFLKFHKWTEKFGGFIVFIGNLTPFPIQIPSLIFGAVRYSIRKFIFYCIIGQIGKYVILLFAKDYIVATVIPYLSALF